MKQNHRVIRHKVCVLPSDSNKNIFFGARAVTYCATCHKQTTSRSQGCWKMPFCPRTWPSTSGKETFRFSLFCGFVCLLTKSTIFSSEPSSLLFCTYELREGMLLMDVWLVSDGQSTTQVVSGQNIVQEHQSLLVPQALLCAVQRKYFFQFCMFGNATVFLYHVYVVLVQFIEFS